MEFVNNNMTVCEEDCKFVKYDNNLKKAVCSCKVNINSTTKIGDIVIDKDKLLKSFTNINNIANINLLKCYKLIFRKKEFKYNYANLIMINIICLYFITLIHFFLKGYYNIKKILDLIVFFKTNIKIKNKFLKRIKENEEQIKKDKNVINNNKNKKRKTNKETKKGNISLNKNTIKKKKETKHEAPFIEQFFNLMRMRHLKSNNNSMSRKIKKNKASFENVSKSIRKNKILINKNISNNRQDNNHTIHSIKLNNNYETY